MTVGAGQGTAVTARDLFGNVPARRKFLRQPSTEIRLHPARRCRLCGHVPDRRLRAGDRRPSRLRHRRLRRCHCRGDCRLGRGGRSRGDPAGTTRRVGRRARGHRRRLDHRPRAVAFPSSGHRHLRQRPMGAEPGARLRPGGGVPLAPPGGTASAGCHPHPPRSSGGRRQRSPYQSRGEVRRRTGGLPGRAARGALRACPPRPRRTAAGPIRTDPNRACGPSAPDPLRASSLRLHRHEKFRARIGAPGSQWIGFSASVRGADVARPRPNRGQLHHRRGS